MPQTNKTLFGMMVLNKKKLPSFFNVKRICRLFHKRRTPVLYAWQSRVFIILFLQSSNYLVYGMTLLTKGYCYTKIMSIT